MNEDGTIGRTNGWARIVARGLVAAVILVARVRRQRPDHHRGAKAKQGRAQAHGPSTGEKRCREVPAILHVVDSR